MLSISENQDYRPVIGSKLKKIIYITLLPRETEHLPNLLKTHSYGVSAEEFLGFFLQLTE